jgi:SAM-dependent methyltransferase
MTTSEPTRDTDPTIAQMPTAPTVVACYSVYDYFFPALGFTDLTDGLYEGDANRPYEAAQARQAEVLLDRAEVEKGSRVLDVGCGYGRILRTAEARGARAWGITVSPEQVRRNTHAGLNARLQDYKHLGSEWDGQFDAVIAYGSLEHFAQAEDAVAGRDDAIYRHLFATVHRLLDGSAHGAKFVTTAIHFRDRPDPRDLLKPPSTFRPHWAEHVWRHRRVVGPPVFARELLEPHEVPPNAPQLCRERGVDGRRLEKNARGNGCVRNAFRLHRFDAEGAPLRERDPRKPRKLPDFLFRGHERNSRLIPRGVDARPCRNYWFRFEVLGIAFFRDFQLPLIRRWYTGHWVTPT